MNSQGSTKTNNKKRQRVGKSDFLKYIEEHFSNTPQEIAEQMGLSYDTFRKKVNKSRESKTRDFIFAIAIIEKLNTDETNKALKAYADFPCLDYTCKRDNLIIKVIDAEVDFPASLRNANRFLAANGEEPLNYHDFRKKKKRPVLEDEADFEIESGDSVRVTVEDIYYDRSFLGIGNSYDPSMFRIYGSMLIRKKHTNEEYNLLIDMNGKCTVQSLNTMKFVNYQSIKDTGEYLPYFVGLQGSINREYKKMLYQLDDTKNYHERFSGILDEDGLHLFVETFNYDIPEANEYYILEYCSGTYKMTVSRKSLFMRKYLGDNYKSYYKDMNYVIKEVHDIHSAEEYHRLLERGNCIVVEEFHLSNAQQGKSVLMSISMDKQFIYEQRRKKYDYLKAKLEQLLSDIKGRKVFIRDLDGFYPFGDTDRVCQFYKVSDAYNCELHVESNMFYAQNKKAEFTSKSGKQIVLSLDELKRAFELGYENIEQICDFKENKGNIENIY